jgi:hypothetical protein
MITGGAKFFNTSLCLAANGATGSSTPSNGSTTALNCLDRNPYTYWYTSGSSDATTEVLTIVLPASSAISRLFLVDHNFKAYSVKYLNGFGVWTDFTNVKGLDGATSGGKIVETAFADTTSYYEFDQVSTTSIQISISSTQVANKDKFLNTLIVTTEIGTLAGFPTIKAVVVDRNSKIKKTLSGRYSIQKSDETAAFVLSFKTYPSAVTYNVDIDLMMTLHDLDAPFLAWLCGGRRGTGYFNYTLRGFRLKDIYQMQIDKAYNLSYTLNVYKNSLNAEVSMQESI